MRSLMAIGLLFVSQILQAGTVQNLYRAELTVAEPVASPTQVQVREGLQQVLIKVSGSQKVLNAPAVQQQLPAAASFLQKYSYESSVAGNLLELDYAPESVNGLIRSAGLKPISSQRPSLLVWIAQEQPQGRDFVTEESTLFAEVEGAADKRGVSLQWPLLDLEDQVAFSVSDLWGLFEDPIRAASARYQADAILAGRAQQSPSGQLSIDAVLFYGGEQRRLSYTGSSAESTMNMLNDVADQLYRPVVSSRGLRDFQSGIAIWVANIQQLSDYIHLMDALRAVPQVSSVNLERVNQSEFILRVEIEGTQAQLQQAIQVEQRLQPVDSLPGPDGRQTLRYFWQG